MTPDRLVVAYVRSVHGLAGAVRVEVLTDRPDERLAVGRRLYVEGAERPLTVAEAVREPRGWRIRFAEVVDRTAAEELRGRYLEADVAEPLPAGHHYWHELLDVPVRDETGRPLGRVVDVYRAGGAEVLSVAGGLLGPLEIPVVGSVVRRLDPGGEGIVVDAAALGLDEEPEGPPLRRAMGAVPARSGGRAAGRGRPGGRR